MNIHELSWSFLVRSLLGSLGASPTMHMFRTLAAGSQVVLVVKNLPANAGDITEVSSVPRLGRSPGGGYGSPLQYSCLENPMDR